MNFNASAKFFAAVGVLSFALGVAAVLVVAPVAALLFGAAAGLAFVGACDAMRRR